MKTTQSHYHTHLEHTSWDNFVWECACKESMPIVLRNSERISHKELVHVL